jgi:pimeloyl-ACP methyl ester carboxylesterase
MVMNRIFIGVGATALLLIALYIVLLPMSAALFHYLRWSAGPSGTAVRGSVKTNDATIYYASYGTGPAVLLLHGGLSNRLVWFSQLPWLVEGGRTTVVVDVRGHDGSGLGKKELNYRLLASDAIHVLDQLHIEKADVIGWSDGGNTALLLCQGWPDRISRMVSISANFNPSGLTSDAMEEAKTNSTGLRYWIMRVWTGAGRKLGELESRIKRMWRIFPLLQPSDLQDIQTPTLVLVGKHDMVSVEHAKKMADLLPHGLLTVVPGGHSALIFQSPEVNKAIAAFLGVPLSKGES